MLKRKNRMTTSRCSNRKSLFFSYKSRSSRSDKEFSISEEKFNHLASGKCFYCGVEFDKEFSDGKSNGIDRFDNSQGYTEDNCVPSCWTCNRAKSDMGAGEFYKWIKRLSGWNQAPPSVKNPDDFAKLSFTKSVETHTVAFGSYEDDALRRLPSLLKGINCISPSLATKITTSAKNNTKVKHACVKFVYSADYTMYPGTASEIFKNLGKPDYLEECIPYVISISEIINCLDDVRASKKERKFFANNYGTGVSISYE
jgi:5-methylcytosine-specific restriction endonuclease McrA